MELSSLVIKKNIRVSNISKIFVSLFYKENIAKKIINKKKIPRLKIFVEKFAMGTAGCLAEIIKKNISNDFLVVNGDIFANLDFNQIIDFHKRKKNEITVGIKKYDINIPYAVMKKKEKKIIFVEKPKRARNLYVKDQLTWHINNALNHIVIQKC